MPDDIEVTETPPTEVTPESPESEVAVIEEETDLVQQELDAIKAQLETLRSELNGHNHEYAGADHTHEYAGADHTHETPPPSDAAPRREHLWLRKVF